MLHTRSLAFIHLQKTGGMSMTRYLASVADDPVTVFSDEPRAHSLSWMDLPEGQAAKLTCRPGRRHEPPAQAVETLRAHGLPVPPRAFVMIRHPVDLMLSYYNHLQKPEVWRYRGMTPDNLRGHVKVAVEQPFRRFCRQVPFYGMSDDQLAAFFDPAAFGQLDVVPLERIGAYLALRCGRNRLYSRVSLGHHNASANTRKAADVPPGLFDMICATYPRLLATYQAACAADWGLNGDVNGET